MNAPSPAFTTHGITLQTQPDNKTCVQTCLAMALGVQVEEVIARYGADPMNQLQLCQALTECGFVWNQFTMGTLAYEGWYFAAVPSLNRRGMSHQILLHSTFQEGLCLSLLDPARGEKYKADGEDLMTWGDLTVFHPGGKLPPPKA